MKIQEPGARPPRNTRRVLSWRDTPAKTAPARYAIEGDSGETRLISLKLGNRRILEALRRGPVFAASPVRISDRILDLRHVFGLVIETEMFASADADGDGERFGIYRLVSRVAPVDDGGAR